MSTTASTDALVKASPSEFRARLLIECNGEPKPLASVQDPWQVKDFAALDNGFRVACGLAPASGQVFQRAFLERPRGHSKTADIAIQVCWLLYASARPIRAIVAAADRDQSRLLLDAIRILCRLNAQLRRVLRVQQNRVLNSQTGSELLVISSDCDTSFGLLPNLVVCDEVCHWSDTLGEELFGSLLSSAAKIASSMFLICSNAGRGQGTSWQWQVREAARQDPSWYFSRLDGPQASWISADKLAEQEAFLPGQVFKRLWLNEWCSTAGDALSEAAIRDSLNLAGPAQCRQDGWSYCGGLDLGVQHDRSALIILGVQQGSNRISLVSCESWKPPRGGSVDLMAVECAVLQAHKKFFLSSLHYDPSQCELMAQQMRRHGVFCQPMTFSPSNLHLMASTLLDCFNSRIVDLFPDKLLLKDLERISIVERLNGWKIEAISDSSGHCDTAIALTAR